MSFDIIYRNGVKPWQFDPTKWIIWVLEIGLAKLEARPGRHYLRAELAASGRRQRGQPRCPTSARGRDGKCGGVIPGRGGHFLAARDFLISRAPAFSTDRQQTGAGCWAERDDRESVDRTV